MVFSCAKLYFKLASLSGNFGAKKIVSKDVYFGIKHIYEALHYVALQEDLWQYSINGSNAVEYEF